MRDFRRWPVCNGHAERAPVCQGHVFPLCWRCTGIMGGALIVGALPEMMPDPDAVMVVASLSAVLLTGVDGYLSNRTAVGSTNVRRAVSGTFAGVGLGLLAGWV